MKQVSLALAFATMAFGASATEVQLWSMLKPGSTTSFQAGVVAVTSNSALDAFWLALSKGGTFSLLGEQTIWAPRQSFIGQTSNGSIETVFSGSDSVGATESVGSLIGVGFQTNALFLPWIGQAAYVTAYRPGVFNNVLLPAGDLRIYQYLSAATPTYAIAYEDWADRDYNDMVVKFAQSAVSAVPEPSSAALMLAGLVGLAVYRRRKDRQI